jgi:hypothetical protein
MNDLNTTYIKEVVLWRDADHKHKKQRNILAIAGAVLLGLLAVK